VRRPVLTLLAVALAGACTDANIIPRGGRADGSIDGSLDGSALDAGPDRRDGGCSYAPVDTMGQPPGCVLELPPGRPSCPDPGTDLEDHFFALHELQLQPTDETGLDLDGYCTTDTMVGPASCEPAPGATGYAVDGEGGVDNAFAASLLSQLGTAYFSLYMTSFTEDIRRFSEAGNGNALVRLRGWNGEPDDQNVNVAFALSVCAVNAGSMATCAGMPMETLDWADQGTTFFPNEMAFMDGDLDRPVVFDDGAYVSGGRLVARLPDAASFRVVTTAGPVDIGVRDAWFLATIAPDGRLTDGVFAGKWPRANIERAANGFGLCPGDLGFDLLGPAINSAVDVRADGSGGPGVICDAVSAVIAFTGERITWGRLEPGTLPIDPCP
jgi:hypothetical protein